MWRGERRLLRDSNLNCRSGLHARLPIVRILFMSIICRHENANILQFERG